jgi:hypothetical protein
MTNFKYVKPDRVLLSKQSELDEKWVQQRLADDPSLLGLGDLVLKDKERIQPHAGRLDLLFQDVDSTHRYEVELQLGKTDESHIIRTIEYWDIERKRYPQYEHTAVIVAEEITGRFLNVIGLFNGFIPLIALQVHAFRLGDQVSLVFTTVLSQVKLGLVDEDEEVAEVADRGYWEARGSKATLEMTDSLLGIVRTIDPELSLKYNKFYIGLAKNGQANNFAIFRPQKDWVRIEFRLERSDDVQVRLDEAGLDVMDYDDRWSRYRVRLVKGDVDKYRPLLTELLQQSYSESAT